MRTFEGFFGTSELKGLRNELFKIKNVTEGAAHKLSETRN